MKGTKQGLIVSVIFSHCQLLSAWRQSQRQRYTYCLKLVVPTLREVNIQKWGQRGVCLNFDLCLICVRKLGSLLYLATRVLLQASLIMILWHLMGLFHRKIRSGQRSKRKLISSIAQLKFTTVWTSCAHRLKLKKKKKKKKCGELASSC